MQISIVKPVYSEQCSTWKIYPLKTGSVNVSLLQQKPQNLITVRYDMFYYVNSLCINVVCCYL